MLPGPKHRVRDLAVDVQLPLAGRGVADPDGTRVLVPRKPIQLVLVESPLAAEAVHDLEVLRVAGDRTEQPVPPAGGLGDVPGGHQCVEKERAVPQPAVAIVPVSNAAQELRQRRRGCGDDAASRLVRQRLQGDQRAFDLLGPTTAIRRLARPLLPPRLCLLKRCHRVDGRWRGLPGGMIGEHEPHSLARGDGKLGRVLEIVALQRHVAAEFERVWTGRRRDGTVHLAHPWPRSSVVETRIEARPHGDRAAHALDHTHHTRVGRP